MNRRKHLITCANNGQTSRSIRTGIHTFSVCSHVSLVVPCGWAKSRRIIVFVVLKVNITQQFFLNNYCTKKLDVFNYNSCYKTGKLFQLFWHCYQKMLLGDDGTWSSYPDLNLNRVNKNESKTLELSKHIWAPYFKDFTIRLIFK